MTLASRRRPDREDVGMSEARGTEPGEVTPPGPAATADPGSSGRRRPARFSSLTRWDLVDAGLAAAAFAALCIVILRTATFMPEPDDYAYRASIVAMTDGHFLTLSAAQVRELARQLAAGPRPGGPGLPPLVQWVQLSSGRWISEKDPGFPFLAVLFQGLGIIRWDQLFYGAIACAGLFSGARRWLGRFGGAAAVGLYCSSGAALLWGWRDYMPTFSDASLIAAGTGALVWSLLAIEASARRRTIAGLAGFVALELATFTRYTDIVMLGCAVVAVLVVWQLPAVRLPRWTLRWWLGSVAVFVVGVGIFDDLVYGGPLTSGYRRGEIQFSLSAIRPNLRYLPAHLMQAMPALVLGLAALAWIIWQRVRQPQALRQSASAGPGGGQAPGRAGAVPGDGLATAARRDLAVGLALAACWLAVWGLYSAYTWTAAPFGTTLQVARFYVPALGAISLLGAWLVTRLPRRESLPAVTALVTAAAIAVMFVLGVRAFNEMLESRIPGARIAGSCQGPPGRVVRTPHGPIRCRSALPRQIAWVIVSGRGRDPGRPKRTGPAQPGEAAPVTATAAPLAASTRTRAPSGAERTALTWRGYPTAGQATLPPWKCSRTATATAVLDSASSRV